MPDILHLVKIHASPDKVYQAITTAEGVRNWWTRDTALDSKVSGTGEFGFNEHQFVIKVKIDELTPQIYLVSLKRYLEGGQGSPNPVDADL
jgi:uncharacterized protein YndB with AHSA1/START domain